MSRKEQDGDGVSPIATVRSGGSFLDRRMSRGRFLNWAGAGVLTVIAGPAILACAPAAPEVASGPQIEDPRSEGERKVLQTALMYEQARQHPDMAEDRDKAASIIKPALINSAELSATLGDYDRTKILPNMNRDRAIPVAVASRMRRLPIETTMPEYVDQIARHPSVNNNYDKAAALGGIAITSGRLQEVLNAHTRVTQEGGVKEEDTVLFTMGVLVEGDHDKVKDVYSKTGDGVLMMASLVNERKTAERRSQSQGSETVAGMQNRGDIESVLSLYNEFKNTGRTEFASKLLTLASVINNFDFMEITEMYNYVGQMDDIDEETAAKLVLETVSAEEARLAVSFEGGDPDIQVAEGGAQTTAGSVSSSVHSGGGGGSYFFYNSGGGYYGGTTTRGGSVTPYRPITTTNSARLAPSTRLSPPAASLSPGKGITGTGARSTGFSGGGARGGSFSGARGGGVSGGG